MSELPLDAYEEQLDEFLEAEAYDEVIVWGKHLLQKFPKCLSGYRYLAQAALEQGQREEAMDLFRRLLSADPEDFVAYAGLASIYQEDSVYDEAIWHMMRAFELRPDNPVIREELRDLYEAQDGHRPGRLKLNPSALGRVYLRNGEYRLAANEFATQLDEDPDRIDLRIARAVALWRAGRRQEAVEESERVLEELPNALRARLLLGQFYAEEGKTDQAGEHLQYARALDPSNSVAQSMFGEESVLPPRIVTLTTPYAEEKMPAEMEDGGDIFGIEEDLVDLAEPGMADWDVEALTIDWRADLRDATEEALVDVPLPAPVPEPADVPAEPVWIQSLRDATAYALEDVPAVEEEPASEPAEPPIEPEPVVEPAPEPEPTPARPEWRANLREATGEQLEQWEPPAVEEEPAVAEDVPAISEPEPEAPAPPPAWRADLRDATESELAAASTEAPPVEAEAPEVIPDVETAPAAWHDELRADTDDVLEEAMPEEEPAPAPPPAWRASLRDATDDALAETPAWRAELRDETGELLDNAEEAPEQVEPEPRPEPPIAPEPALEPEPEIANEVQEAPAPEVEIPADPLERARQVARSGDDDAALDAFQAAFDADDGRDEELAAAMREWIDSGVDSGGPHQLLGDVYRRMGRLQDAVEEYRIALQKT